MDTIKQLEEILKTDVLIEVNEDIKQLQKQIAIKKNSTALKEELMYMQQVKQYFDEVLLDIEHNNLSKKDAVDILQSLEEMRIENDSL
jgi:Fe2+ transport system protein B